MAGGYGVRWVLGVDVEEALDNWQPRRSTAVDSLSDARMLDSKHGALGCSTVVEGPECVSRFTP
jgi:hypothetical protein